MVQNIITDLCHHLEIGIDGNLDIGNKKVIVGTPAITLIGNTFTISCSTSNVNIYYTLDGSTPTSNSIRYTSAVTLNNSCIIKAIAIKDNKYSAIVEEIYVKPITYLTQWKIVGNSEVHTLPYPDGVVLPTGYKRCKYLEAHGTEYIELPIGFDNTDEIELTVSFTQIRLSDKYAIAPKTWNDNNNRFAMGIHNVNTQGSVSDYFFCAGYGSARTSKTVYIPCVSQDTNVHLFTYTNYLFKLDNSSTVDVSEITFGGTTDNLRLFYGYDSPTKCRIYAYHQVKTNNTEINLIPCLDDSDVPCLYDTINQTTLYNQGTGTFGYELYPQPTEIWSCGEYNPIDGKYHILVQPQGGSIVDIALSGPLRKVNDIADTIEFPSDTEGKALVTRKINSIRIGSCKISSNITIDDSKKRMEIKSTKAKPAASENDVANIICSEFNTITFNTLYSCNTGIAVDTTGLISFYTPDYNTTTDTNNFKKAYRDIRVIFERAVISTELVDAPQIAEADSYSCVISQGGKAVSWSEFLYTINYLLTDSENNLLVDSENYQLTVQN